MDDSLFGGLFDRGAAATDDQAWLQAMLDTEAALARAAERAGLAPPGNGAAVTSAARAESFQAAALAAAATATGNPVPALVKALTALAPPEAVVHLGATSQDIIDTAAMLLARQAIDATMAGLAAAAASCAALTRAHAETVMAGRTLMQQAVPVTFGLVAANWLTAIDEARSHLHRVRTTALAIQYGGAAGTLAPLADAGPAVAELLAVELGLANPVLPWHTNRLRLLDLAAALAATCAALGKVARDVTLLSQTEIAEVQEATPGGSSTMPHKRNPVAAIVILGHTKQAPHLLAALASAAEQEHQRAAGAWHSEWQPLTHLLRLTTSATTWAADLLRGLQVDRARMRANLDATQGQTQAEHVAALLTPTLGKQEAQALLTRAATRAATEGFSLAEALLTDEESAAPLSAAGLGPSDLTAALDPTTYLGATPQLITRALSAHESLNSALG